jgi:PTH1 family peptidyl-tRNA hydrolase
MWQLVPLGNPGDDYAQTRHNLGRLMLQRWLESRPKPTVARRYPSGTLYALQPPFQALVPDTWMNLSGQVVAEAEPDPYRLILLYDDKELPLGTGRFRVSGSDGGHNGLKSVFEAVGHRDVPRLRLGIGPIQRPLVDFVLGTWTDEEWRLIDALDEPFARFMELLAGTRSLSILTGQVNADRFWTPPAPKSSL